MMWFLDGIVTARQHEDFLAGFQAWLRLYYEEYSDATSVEPEYLAAWRTITGETDPLFNPLNDAELMDVIAEVQAAITDETGRAFDPIDDND